MSGANYIFPQETIPFTIENQVESISVGAGIEIYLKYVRESPMNSSLYLNTLFQRLREVIAAYENVRELAPDGSKKTKKALEYAYRVADFDELISLFELEDEAPYPITAFLEDFLTSSAEAYANALESNLKENNYTYLGQKGFVDWVFAKGGEGNHFLGYGDFMREEPKISHNISMEASCKALFGVGYQEWLDNAWRADRGRIMESSKEMEGFLARIGYSIVKSNVSCV
jgi:hypothetical protein